MLLSNYYYIPKLYMHVRPCYEGYLWLLLHLKFTDYVSLWIHRIWQNGGQAGTKIIQECRKYIHIYPEFKC